MYNDNDYYATLTRTMYYVVAQHLEQDNINQQVHPLPVVLKCTQL